MKKFAIIIVNYNSFKDVKQAIKSLEIFDRKVFDIFLVDNFSTKDDFEEIAKYTQIKGIRFLPVSQNLGFAGGNNVALREILKLNYPYIFLLNPDMLVTDPNFFDVIEKEIKLTGADIIGPLVKYYPETNKIYFAGGFVNKYTGLTTMRRKGQYFKSEECDFVTACSVIIKREVFQKIGLLPEEYFLYFEETDFCLKAKKSGFKIVFTPKAFIFHKVSTTIQYLSSTYLYYMIKNQRIFSRKHVKSFFKPIFWLFYIFVWCSGYAFLAIKNKQAGRLKFILKGAFNLPL